MKKNQFNQEGVQLWLQKLYNSTVENQMMEQNLILNCLLSWAISRFEFAEDQIAYIESLPADFKQNLAQEIAFTINNQLDITLDKKTDAETTSTLARDSVKVSEYEASKSQSATDEASTSTLTDEVITRGCEGHLTIRIYYKLI